jgi:hypothetical protein
MKANKILLIYFIVYSLITICFIYNIKHDHSHDSLLGYIFILPFFWIISGIVLARLFFRKELRLFTVIDWVLLFLSTPIPFLILVFLRLI